MAETNDKAEEVVHRLGGRSKIDMLQEEVSSLRREISMLKVKPGATITPSLCVGLIWFTSTGSIATVYSDIIIEALGADWAVARDSILDNIYFAYEPDMRLALLPGVE